MPASSHSSFESSSRSSSRSSSPVSPRATTAGAQPPAPVPVPVPVPAQASAHSPSRPVSAPQPQPPISGIATNHVATPKASGPTFVDDRVRLQQEQRNGENGAARPRIDSSDNESDEVDAQNVQRNPDGSTTRILTADQFRKIFQQNIAKAQHYETTTSAVPATAGGSRPASSSAGKRHVTPVHAKDFIDPYNGTKFRNRIVVPKSPKRPNGSPPRQRSPQQPPSQRKPKTAGSNRKRASSKLREEVRTAQAVVGGAVPSADATDRELSLAQELMNLKHSMQLREKEYDVMRIKLNKALEQQHKSETTMLRNRPEQEAQSLQQFVDYLKGKNSFDEGRIADLEEQLYQLKQSSRVSRLGELQQQNGVYLAESRRLSRQVNELTTLIKAGGESAQLQEANHLLKQKEAQVVTYQEKLHASREDCRRAEAEAHKWRTTYEADRREMEESRRRIDDLRQAPVEITRLRKDLDDAKSTIAQLQRQLSSTSSNERGSVQQHHNTANKSSSDATAVDSLVRERDLLLLQLKDRERSAEAQRTEIARRTQELDREVEAKALVRLDAERALSRDREEQLRRQVHEWESRYKDLEDMNKRLKDQHREEAERQRVKEQQRQENMLATVGKYEKERMIDLQRSMEDREKQLQLRIDVLESERAHWEAERAHRADEIETLKKQAQNLQAQAGSRTPPTVAQFQQQPQQPQMQQVVLPAAPAPSSKGPTISQNHQPSAGLLREMVVATPQRPSAVNEIASSASSTTGAVPPVVRTVAGSRPETHTPTNVPPAGRKEAHQEPPRYDKGDDTQSEITVKQGLDTDGRTSPLSQGDNESEESDLGEVNDGRGEGAQQAPAHQHAVRPPPIPVSVVNPPAASPNAPGTPHKGPLVVQLVKPSVAAASNTQLKAASPQKSGVAGGGLSSSNPSFSGAPQSGYPQVPATANPAVPIPAPPAPHAPIPVASAAPPQPIVAAASHSAAATPASSVSTPVQQPSTAAPAPLPIPQPLPMPQPVAVPTPLPQPSLPIPQPVTAPAQLPVPQPLPTPQPLPGMNALAPAAPTPKPLPVPQAAASAVPPPQPLVSPLPVPQPVSPSLAVPQRPVVPQPLPVPAVPAAAVPPPQPMLPSNVASAALGALNQSNVPQPPPLVTDPKAATKHIPIKKPPPKKVESTETSSSSDGELDDFDED